MQTGSLNRTCNKIRRHIIQMTAQAGSGHPGGSLSSVEILVALYFYKMRIDPAFPLDPNRDRFVLSKGHAAPCLYAVLAERGYFPVEELQQFRKLHSFLQGHPDSKKCPGIDISTGSLGQGFSSACGMALGAKRMGSSFHVYVLCGDGELQEGLVWEAAESAAHYKLNNLTVLVDNNGLQIDGRNCDVMDLRSLEGKFDAFGFDVLSVENGNDLEALIAALDVSAHETRPRAIIAHTTKGKGISFMENQASWHGKAPDPQQCAQALAELEAQYV